MDEGWEGGRSWGGKVICANNQLTKGLTHWDPSVPRTRNSQSGQRWERGAEHGEGKVAMRDRPQIKEGQNRHMVSPTSPPLSAASSTRQSQYRPAPPSPTFPLVPPPSTQAPHQQPPSWLSQSSWSPEPLLSLTPGIEGQSQGGRCKLAVSHAIREEPGQEEGVSSLSPGVCR